MTDPTAAEATDQATPTDSSEGIDGEVTNSTEDVEEVDTFCDSNIENCTAEPEVAVVSNVDLQAEYDDLQEFTLFIGLSLSVFAYVPMFIFLYPTWFGATSAHRTILINDHITYVGAWAFTAILNVIMFGPWQIAWLILFFFS